ncbi:hypothetical protein H0H87_007561 [Tephrocybe sp. NHM501043]|nr:hypothetical protein H0H87_007561 [Tephrocybe sp. NHM501043]
MGPDRYSGIKYIFDSGLLDASATISTLMFCVLVVCGYMTGAGGNAGLTGAVNSTAKTFPDKARATATGVVISGFGLSAFLFSTISRVEFAGNTSSFLRLLSLGTAIPMIAGFFFVRPIPLPPSEASEEGQHTPITLEEHGGEQSALLAEQEGVPEQVSLVLEQLSRRAALNQGLAPNVYGRKLWTSSDFWLLFAILSMRDGILYRGRYQAPLDGERNTGPRAWERVLPLPKCLLGMVRDACVPLIYPPNPSARIDMHAAHFSENWGYLSASPIVAGNLFSVVFGNNLDAHDSAPSTNGTSLNASTRAATMFTGSCTLGRKCYVDALYLTTAATFSCILLSVWAGLRDRKKLAVGAAMTRQSRVSEMLGEDTDRNE